MLSLIVKEPENKFMAQNNLALVYYNNLVIKKLIGLFFEQFILAYLYESWNGIVLFLDKIVADVDYFLAFQLNGYSYIFLR